MAEAHDPPSGGTRAPKRVRLRIVLILPILGLLTASSLLIGWMSYRNGQRMVEDLSRRVLAQLNARIADQLNAFLDPPLRINRLNAAEMAAGSVPVADQAALQQRFLRQVQAWESVNSVYFGSPEGGLANAGREGRGGPLYVMGTDGFAAGRLRKLSVDRAGRPGTVLTEVPSFDARKRPWYEAALRGDGPSWTGPYVLSTGQDMAVSASLAVRSPAGVLLGIASVDVFLSQISGFLAALNVVRSGYSFVMEPSGSLVATPEGAPLLVGGREAAENGNPLVRGAAEALSRRIGDLRAVEGDRELQESIGGARQFLLVSPYRTVEGLDWLVVSVVPAEEFMGPIEANTQSTSLAAFLTLLAALAVGGIVAALVTRPILRLHASTRDIVGGAWGEEVEEDSRLLEIHGLTASFNAMVARLRRTMDGLSVEVEERRRAEALARTSERMLHQVIDQSVEGIVLADENGRVFEWNAAMAGLLGIPREKAVDRPLWHLQMEFLPKPLRTEETARRMEALLVDYFRTGTLPPGLQGVSSREIEDSRGNGISIEIAVFPIHADRGHMLGALVRDITARREAEKERERLIEELQAALREVKQLSSLLPICASCKRIRDEGGTWHSVETYIHAHAGVDFTHGLCPECVEKHYGEFLRKSR